MVETKRSKQHRAAYKLNERIVTTIEPAAPFYVAEGQHQDYYARNPDQGYCIAVVGPKVKKFKALFADKLKGAQH